MTHNRITAIFLSVFCLFCFAMKSQAQTFFHYFPSADSFKKYGSSALTSVITTGDGYVLTGAVYKGFNHSGFVMKIGKDLRQRWIIVIPGNKILEFTHVFETDKGDYLCVGKSIDDDVYAYNIDKNGNITGERSCGKLLYKNCVYRKGNELLFLSSSTDIVSGYELWKSVDGPAFFLRAWPGIILRSAFENMNNGNMAVSVIINGQSKLSYINATGKVLYDRILCSKVNGPEDALLCPAPNGIITVQSTAAKPFQDKSSVGSDIIAWGTNGKKLWSVRLDAPNYASLKPLKDGSGYIFLSFTFSRSYPGSPYRPFLAVINTNGTVRWQKNYPQIADMNYDIWALSNDKGFLVVGTNRRIDYGSNIVLWQVDTNGNIIN